MNMNQSTSVLICAYPVPSQSLVQSYTCLISDDDVIVLW